MDTLLGLCRYESCQAENGVRLEIITSVLIIYGSLKAIGLGAYIPINAI